MLANERVQTQKDRLLDQAEVRKGSDVGIRTDNPRLAELRPSFDHRGHAALIGTGAVPAADTERLSSLAREWSHESVDADGRQALRQ